MGRPQDFEDEEKGEQPDNTKVGSENINDEKAENFFHYDLKGKRLYRDENNKILGGVCSGIAAYFGIDPVIVRVLFIISGIGCLLYTSPSPRDRQKSRMPSSA